jgi:halocyanin-like protein
MESDETPSLVTRRGVLRGVAAGATLTAAAGTAAAQSIDYGGWFDDVGNYDGTTVDATGQSEVTIGVGTEGNGGAFAFDPPAVQIDPGTTVIWEWTGEGGQHNVVAESGGDFESELTATAGFTFEHTFEEEGIVTYYCQPHRSLGMKAAVAVGDVGGGGGGGDGGDGGGGGGAARPSVPETAKSLAVATVSAMVTVLALAYFFIRFGGDYGSEGDRAA